ncbi:MAG: tryptophanyl-tRNA synthetase [Rickettsiales bacterium]|jgi:tryptophanyl-tRNA synthetase
MTKILPAIFSGIQPTGNLHLGNYLGSIANWKPLQETHNCLFGIMDLHSITLPQNPATLRNNILETAIVYLASGINPTKSAIFAQSRIKEHAELAWILSTLTPLGWLNRMTQFKEKSANNENLGLFAYPVLMAADILLYKSDVVPVGEDQKQHLELARDIAGAFNRQFKNEFFKLPEPFILGNCTRVMSLQDGTKKMSKSDESILSRINLADEKDFIIKKIKKAKTDSTLGISYDKNRPEIFNLLNIFSAMSEQKPEELATKYQDSGNGKFKEDLAEALIVKLDPIQSEIKRLKNDLSFVKQILQDGEEKARTIAELNIKKIKEIVGLY